MTQVFEHDFFFDRCKENFIFPAATDHAHSFNGTIVSISHVLVCVDFEERKIKSYQLISVSREGGDTPLYFINKTNTIKYAYTRFVDFTYDIAERVVIGLV
jgi:hypothetical protein